MSISNLQSTMQGNFARPNLFKVHIYTNGIKSPSINFKQGLAIKCHTASIPGLEIATTDKDFSYRSYGYQKLYSDISLSFYCTEEMRELQFLQEWMKKIIQPADNRVGYYSDYIGNIDIIKLDRQQNKSMTTHIYEAYPKGVSAMELGYGSNDEVMSVTANFTYRYYTQEFGGTQETKARGRLTPTQRENITSGTIDKTLTNQQRKDIFDGTVNETSDDLEF
jgi:hypothetical protein